MAECLPPSFYFFPFLFLFLFFPGLKLDSSLQWLLFNFPTERRQERTLHCPVPGLVVVAQEVPAERGMPSCSAFWVRHGRGVPADRVISSSPFQIVPRENTPSEDLNIPFFG